MRRDFSLAEAALGDLSLIKMAALVVAGTLLIALAAQVSVPMFPVPMTLQTLAIMLVGFTLGSRLGAVTLLAYLAEGAMGLPVFASGNAGLPYMMGPTGGFLLGFVAMAWIAGLASDRGWTGSLIATIAVALVASAVIYIPGLAWPAAMLGTDAASLWASWTAPFLLGDAVKAVIAALIVTGAFAAMKRTR